MGTIAQEVETRAELVGTPDNPARDPKSLPKEGKGTVGDTALMDALKLVIIAWALLLVLYLSLYRHSV